MNAYKLNGRAGHYYRRMICESIGIDFTEIYKTVKDIDKDAKEYRRNLKEGKAELKRMMNDLAGLDE